MPEISRFFGIIIKMFFDDHNPPHFHVEYGGFKAIMDIQTRRIIDGEIPLKQLRLVEAWAEIYERELLENFNNLNSEVKSFKKIDPLA